MSYKDVLYELNDGVARISMNRPDTLNAMNDNMGTELLDAINRAGREARAVILTGEGRAFCSGANLEPGRIDLTDPARDIGRTIDPLYNPLIIAIKRIEAPVITVVRGPAAGLGCGIALAGDLILVSETGYFLLAFRHVGLAPDGGTSYFLTRAIGRVRAMSLMLRGGRIYGPQAVEWGLATEVHPDADLDAKAMELAQEMASGPRSIGIIKRVAWETLDTTLESTLSIERLAQREACRTEDFVEGVTAFRERRKAQFKGR